MQEEQVLTPGSALVVLYHVSALTRGIMLDTGIPLDSILFLIAYLLLFFGACYYMIKNNKC